MKNVTFDLSTAIGIIIAISFVVVAILLGGGSISAFFDIKSFFIVIGGTFFLTTACFTIPEIVHSQIVVIRSIFYTAEDPSRAALLSLELAEIARKQGLLKLQSHPELLNKNKFLKKGITLVIDGINHEDVERILDQEIGATFDRHTKSSNILRKAAEIAPAMGLIGTLIGLVQMLGSLADPTTIGPAMAIALLTTLYGAMLAYMVLAPLASKLERNSKAEALIMRIYLSTIVSIGRKENPRRLEMLINALLPPARRVKYFS